MKSSRKPQLDGWIIPLAYVLVTLIVGISFPRLEHHFLPDLTSAMSAPAAMAICSSISSGMIALTGIVFSLAFVMVQFSATACSPRLVLWVAPRSFNGFKALTTELPKRGTDSVGSRLRLALCRQPKNRKVPAAPASTGELGAIIAELLKPELRGGAGLSDVLKRKRSSPLMNCSLEGKMSHLG